MRYGGKLTAVRQTFYKNSVCPREFPQAKVELAE
jgi:hypothetical protein